MSRAFQMAWHDLKHRGVSLFITFVFAMFIGQTFGHHVVRIISDEIQGTLLFSTFYFIDFMLLGLLPVLGSLMFSKEYLSWSIVTEEPFLKRLRFYRMWAIPVSIIAWSRITYMLICLGVAMAGFLLSFIITSWSDVLTVGSVGELMAYLMIWFSYAVALNGINPYLEYGTNGKTVIIGGFVIALIALGMAALSRFILNQPLYVWLFDLVQGQMTGSIIVSILLGATGLLVFQKALVYRISSKDLP